MTEVRQRNTAKEPQDATPKTASEQIKAEDKSANKFKLMDLVRILGGLVLLNCALSYFITADPYAWGYRPWWINPSQVQRWIVSVSLHWRIYGY